MTLYNSRKYLDRKAHQPIEPRDTPLILMLVKFILWQVLGLLCVASYFLIIYAINNIH